MFRQKVGREPHCYSVTMLESSQLRDLDNSMFSVRIFASFAGLSKELSRGTASNSMVMKSIADLDAQIILELKMRVGSAILHLEVKDDGIGRVRI